MSSRNHKQRGEGQEAKQLQESCGCACPSMAITMPWHWPQWSAGGSLNDVPFKELYLVSAVLVTLLHKILDFRQLKAIKRPKPPPELEKAFKDPDLYKKTQAYSLEKWWFGVAQSTVNLVETLTLVSIGALPWAWQLSGDVLGYVPAHVGQYVGLGSSASAAAIERWQSVVFTLLLSGWSLVTGLPWSLWSTFVIEARHGFNKQTMALFLGDLVKSVLLGLVLLPPLVLGMTAILQVASPFIALYLWAFMLTFSLIMLTVYPTLIQPLFNKFTPLQEGPLREQIEALAGSLKFPLKKLYVMDGSRHSAHSNAYMYGFFKNKRIVLYDTLIQQCSETEVVAVLAHELGHWKLRHTAVNFVLGQAILLAQFSLFSFIRSTPALYASFGFTAAQPALIAFILFQLISAPLDEVINFCLHMVSRRFEFQADSFATTLGHGTALRTALLVMQEENKGTMHVDPWYSAYHYSHPHLVERLRAIDKNMEALTKKTT